MKAARFYAPHRYQPGDSVGFLMRQVLASILAQADGRLAAHGLTYVQWLPLYKLGGQGADGATAAALARQLGIGPAAMTRALDRLESKGLIARERSASDRRVIHRALTGAGHRVAAAVPPVLAEVLNQHLAGFTRAEWRTLLDLLRRMLANGEALRQPLAP